MVEVCWSEKHIQQLFSWSQRLLGQHTNIDDHYPGYRKWSIAMISISPIGIIQTSWPSSMDLFSASQFNKDYRPRISSTECFQVLLNDSLEDSLVTLICHCRIIITYSYCWWKTSCTSWYVVYPNQLVQDFFSSIEIPILNTSCNTKLSLVLVPEKVDSELGWMIFISKKPWLKAEIGKIPVHKWATKKKDSYFPLYWLVYRDPYNGLYNPYITG